MTKLFCVSDVFLLFFFVFFMCVHDKMRRAESRSIIQTCNKKLMVVLGAAACYTHPVMKQQSE